MERLPKRLGSLSIASLRDDSIEAIAVASVLSRIGTSDQLSRADDAEVINGFDMARFGEYPSF